MGKLLKVILAALLALLVFNVALERFFLQREEVRYGVSFSGKHAKYLGLDPKNIYLQMMDTLGVKNIRLVAFWNVLEPVEGKYDFEDLDFFLKEANSRNVKIVLVLGARQPRWPECHVPAWAKDLKTEIKQQKVLNFIQQVVQRYKNYGNIKIWQVENEPFVSWFGEKCDTPDAGFLSEEITLVKRLDPEKPIMVTDTGEWSSWSSAMKLSDVLGVSLYRKSYNHLLGIYIPYPIPFWTYTLKSGLVRKFFAPQNTKTVISELQAEPWFQKSATETPIEQHAKLFSLTDFKGNIEYARKTGIDEQYLWGVEWWYYMAGNGYPEYLEYAKSLFK